MKVSRLVSAVFVVLALGDEILDVEVEGRRFLGQLGEIGRARVERTTLEDVENGDDRQNPAPARRARGHRRRLVGAAVDAREPRGSLRVLLTAFQAFLMT